VTDGSFGSRLRRERERRQIALSSLSANTKIGVSLFEGLERDDVSRWPPGIFRRSFIRAYAQGIGLDPDEVTQEFLERFPDPLEPLSPAMGPAPTSAAAGGTALRLTLADTGAWFVSGAALLDMRYRWAAIACDAGVVVAIAVSVFVATGTFWLPLAVSMLGYYLGGILLLGNTPGVCLWAPGSSRSGARVIMATLRSEAMKFLLQFVVRTMHRREEKHRPLERTTV
jgi:transcriptional regulator with XRE-family HTH domain